MSGTAWLGAAANVAQGFSREIVHKIYDDDTGEHIARIVGHPQQLRLLAESILMLTEESK